MVLVIAGIWFYTSTFPMLFEESGYDVWRAKFMAIDSCSTDGTVMIGDSRAQSAFDPAYFSGDAHNLSFGAATPLEVFLVFRKIVRCLQPGQQVMVSISPSEFMHVQIYLWENGARYGYFSFSDLRLLAAGASAVHDDSLREAETRFGNGLWRDLIYGLHFPSIYFNNLLSARVFRRGSANAGLLAETLKRHGFLPFGNKGGVVGPSKEANLAHFKALPVDDYFFRKLVQLATDRGVTLRFVAAPLSRLSERWISQTYMSDFRQYLEEVAHGRAFRIDGPLFYAMPNAFFSDDVHLNQQGAHAFTEWLKACVKSGNCNPALLATDEPDPPITALWAE